ncbi:hypothetical protein [Mesoplasma lactucae]|uniref:Uncharacterized protein n=1 Tax=Mesoplasma lactucae ATCC 49193 TaxID=81460 RepID=A0A291IRH7_9MOLU|nr:hypothetical protein [Mesoplasma lactucae]ATG97338.1 hypothetical protein CP520_01020 [Mesoplasma lactucae ATCC 49193]ATZ20210.1 hypothetical protein MLACT_v1c03890 [Mesoplasma lactucae ATCC 49193]MCL8216959.1 hypothetical protein [Mesoplasma lactucae ATCC 49193]
MSTINIILILVVVAIIIFIIVTTITGKKASKKERSKRKKEVREAIKQYIADNENQKNVRVDFEKVYARKGAEYKYRDVFDVVVDLIEPKTNEIKETRAYEVEGITQKIDKKNYNTVWKVNGSLDLDETKRRIAIAEKEIKLSKKEKEIIKREEKAKERKAREDRKKELAEAKKSSKENKKASKNDASLERPNKVVGEKFVPSRRKND